MQKHFLIVAAGFAGGIAFRSFFDFGMAFAFFLALLGVAAAALFLKKKSAAVLFSGLFIVALGFGVARADFAETPSRAHALDEFMEKTILLEGVISDEPDVRSGHTKLTVAIQGVVSQENEISRETKIRVVAPHHPEFSYGDTVRIRGVPQKPSSALQDEEGTGRSFNYAAYLAKDSVYYEMFYPSIERLDYGGGNPIKRALFSLKRAYLQNLGAALPEPHAALAGGITVGTKEALGDELLEMFRTAGIIHIVVLSGYNITIVAETIGRAFAFAPRMLGLGFSAGSIMLFAVMTGGGATVMRASLMALLVLLARATGRVSEITVALVAAAFFMLLANPLILAFDPSFQLSFLATAGLLFFAPHTARFFRWLPAVFGIREVASATLAAQIFVLPALVYMMGTFSVVAFAVNILILPFIPLSMLFSFLTGAAGFLSPIASIPFSYAAFALLEYSLRITKFFATLPFASFAVTLPFWLVFILYGFLAVVLVFYANKKAP